VLEALKVQEREIGCGVQKEKGFARLDFGRDSLDMLSSMQSDVVRSLHHKCLSADMPRWVMLKDASKPGLVLPTTALAARHGEIFAIGSKAVIAAPG
jgi:hypothetical protein